MRISAARYIIERFGGLTKTANALGVPVTTVQGWKERENIPSERWLGIIDALREIDVRFEPGDFLREHDVEAAERAA